MTSRVVDHSRQFLRNAENELEKAIARGTFKVQREAGRLVGQYASPPPSEPGEPPHQDTGTLIRSIESETYRDGRAFIGRIGTNLKYGRYLELGTRIMGARPWLRPALSNMRREIVREIRRAGGRVTFGRSR